MARRRHLLVLLSVLLVAAPTPATAQFELDGYVGAYVPTTDLVNEASINLAAKQTSSVAFGARATLWLAVLGLEGTLLYAPSTAESADAGTVTKESANIWAASARLALKLGLPLLPIAFYLNGGPAVIGRSGDAYADVEDTTDIGGVAGLGVRFGRSSIRVRADAEAYLYPFKGQTDTGLELDSAVQADLVFSAGLVFAL